MIVQDNITVILEGTVTLGRLQTTVKRELSPIWTINLIKWQKEKNKRIRIVTSDPYVREFNIPILCIKEKGENDDRLVPQGL